MGKEWVFRKRKKKERERIFSPTSFLETQQYFFFVSFHTNIRSSSSACLRPFPPLYWKNLRNLWAQMTAAQFRVMKGKQMTDGQAVKSQQQSSWGSRKSTAAVKKCTAPLWLFTQNVCCTVIHWVFPLCSAQVKWSCKSLKCCLWICYTAQFCHLKWLCLDSGPALTHSRPSLPTPSHPSNYTLLGENGITCRGT